MLDDDDDDDSIGVNVFGIGGGVELPIGGVCSIYRSRWLCMTEELSLVFGCCCFCYHFCCCHRFMTVIIGSRLRRRFVIGGQRCVLLACGRGDRVAPVCCSPRLVRWLSSSVVGGSCIWCPLLVAFSSTQLDGGFNGAPDRRTCLCLAVPCSNAVVAPRDLSLSGCAGFFFDAV